LKEQSAIKFEKKQSAKQKCAKNKPKKQANFIYNKPKNKQPASLQKNPQLRKKTSPISRENRKVDNTGQAATVIRQRREAINISASMKTSYCYDIVT